MIRKVRNAPNPGKANPRLLPTNPLGTTAGMAAGTGVDAAFGRDGEDGGGGEDGEGGGGGGGGGSRFSLRAAEGDV